MGDYITITTDADYLHHCGCFLLTLKKHSINKPSVLLRTVNVSARHIKLLQAIYPGIEIISDNVSLSTTPDRLKGDESWSWAGYNNMKDKSFLVSDLMCYTNNMRFHNICILLQRPHVKRVINMDVDQLFINDFSFDDLFETGDILTFNEHDQHEIVCVDDIERGVWIPDVWRSDESYNTSEPLIDESMIATVNNKFTRSFFNQARDRIERDFFNWDADFNILNQLYSEFKNTIVFKTPKIKYIDRWYYDDSSVIWNGAGNNRVTVSKYVNKKNAITEQWNQLIQQN